MKVSIPYGYLCTYGSAGWFIAKRTPWTPSESMTPADERAAGEQAALPPEGSFLVAHVCVGSTIFVWVDARVQPPTARRPSLEASLRQTAGTDVVIGLVSASDDVELLGESGHEQQMIAAVGAATVNRIWGWDERPAMEIRVSGQSFLVKLRMEHDDCHASCALHDAPP